MQLIIVLLFVEATLLLSSQTQVSHLPQQLAGGLLHLSHSILQLQDVMVILAVLLSVNDRTAETVQLGAGKTDSLHLPTAAGGVASSAARFHC